MKATNTLVFTIAIFLSPQADHELDLQLFKLYHNEREVDSLTKELDRKNNSLRRESEEQRKIEDELKEKKKEHAKLIRDISKMEQQYKDLVGPRVYDHHCSRLSLTIYFLFITSNPGNRVEQEKTSVH